MNTIAARFALPLTLCLWAIPAWSEGPSLDAAVWQPGHPDPLEQTQLDRVLSAPPVLLLGENHGNPDHHALQARLVSELAQRQPRIELILEMVPREYQPRLDRANLEAADRWNADDWQVLGEDLDWEARGWPAWALYRPALQAAVESGGWLRAGGPSQAHMTLARSGRLDQALADPVFANLAPRDWPEAFESALTAEIDAAHCNLIPSEALPLAAQVQRLRDAQIAQGVADARARGHGAAVIAGSGHVRNDRALGWYLPQALREETLAIGFVQSDAPSAEIAAELPYDLVWFTPLRDSADPCERMRAAMQAQ